MPKAPYGFRPTMTMTVLASLMVPAASSFAADSTADAAATSIAAPSPLASPNEGSPPSLLPQFEGWSLHAQSTVIRQQHWDFTSPYSGPNSLTAQGDTEHTWTNTLYIGRRLWPGAEFDVDPEMAQGIGFNYTTGIAGFPNGEATRSTTNSPRYYFARWFLRQTFGLGGEERTAIADEPNHVATTADSRRLVVTVGKMAANDLFDDNAYSHDPRTQFLNWALFETGAWDYPADARGYDRGAVIELIMPTWALRLGTFLEPGHPNALRMDDDIVHSHGDIAELEEDYAVAGCAGAARLLLFHNRAHMIDYRAAVASQDFALVTSQYSSKYGAGLSLEQTVCDGAGIFLRLGWNDGRTEDYAFTEIDRSAALGMSLSGAAWRRKDDVLGLAVLENGLSRDHRDFLAAGGTGFIIGDGQLHYAPERIAEVYYAMRLCPAFTATIDYQFVANPAYNQDRGPVSILSLRGHIDL